MANDVLDDLLCHTVSPRVLGDALNGTSFVLCQRAGFWENLLPSFVVVESGIFLLLVLNMWRQLSLNCLLVRFVTSFGAGIRVANVNLLRGGYISCGVSFTRQCFSGTHRSELMASAIWSLQ